MGMFTKLYTCIPIITLGYFGIFRSPQVFYDKEVGEHLDPKTGNGSGFISTTAVPRSPGHLEAVHAWPELGGVTLGSNHSKSQQQGEMAVASSSPGDTRISTMGVSSHPKMI
jgi:hypothetical protein